MVSGYPDSEHKAFRNFGEAKKWLTIAGHDTFHFCQGIVDGEEESPHNEHGGSPVCYVAAIDGRDGAIYETYGYGQLLGSVFRG